MADSFPPGEAKTQKILAYTIQQDALVRERRVAKLATPTMAWGAPDLCHSMCCLNKLSFTIHQQRRIEP